MERGTTQDNFNSIKVQLKLMFPKRVRGRYVEFQFHKGTIKTAKWFYGVGVAYIFQFHKGTIKT